MYGKSNSSELLGCSMKKWTWRLSAIRHNKTVRVASLRSQAVGTVTSHDAQHAVTAHLTLLPSFTLACATYLRWGEPKITDFDLFEVDLFTHIQLWQGRPAASRPPGRSRNSFMQARIRPVLGKRLDNLHLWLLDLRTTQSLDQHTVNKSSSGRAWISKKSLRSKMHRQERSGSWGNHTTTANQHPRSERLVSTSILVASSQKIQRKDTL